MEDFSPLLLQNICKDTSYIWFLSLFFLFFPILIPGDANI